MLALNGLSRLVIDEAHSVSRRIARAIARLGRPPILALTTEAEADDIAEKLAMRDPVIVRGAS